MVNYNNDIANNGRFNSLWPKISLFIKILINVIIIVPIIYFLFLYIWVPKSLLGEAINYILNHLILVYLYITFVILISLIIYLITLNKAATAKSLKEKRINKLLVRVIFGVIIVSWPFTTIMIGLLSPEHPTILFEYKRYWIPMYLISAGLLSWITYKRLKRRENSLPR